MKNNNTTGTKFYEPNMEHVETDEAISTINGTSVTSKSISDRLDKMESMLLYSIDKMAIIDRKLDDFMDNINIRTVGQVHKNDNQSNEGRTWFDELKSKL
jgi:hypothetical protein